MHGCPGEVFAKAQLLATDGAFDKGNAAGVAGGAGLVAGIAGLSNASPRAIVVRGALAGAEGARVHTAGVRLIHGLDAQPSRALGRRRVVGPLRGRSGNPDVAGMAEV